jgi:hypothetical protein
MKCTGAKQTGSTGTLTHLLAGGSTRLSVHDVCRVFDNLLGEAEPQAPETNSTAADEENLSTLIHEVLDLCGETRRTRGGMGRMSGM